MNRSIRSRSLVAAFLFAASAALGVASASNASAAVDPVHTVSTRVTSQVVADGSPTVTYQCAPDVAPSPKTCSQVAYASPLDEPLTLRGAFNILTTILVLLLASMVFGLLLRYTWGPRYDNQWDAFTGSAKAGLLKTRPVSEKRK